MQNNDTQFFETFDAFLTLLQNPSVGEQVTVENVIHTFHCAHFIEVVIAKIQAEGKECELQKCLQEYRRLKDKSFSYTCSDLEKACDKLLECYLKNCHISSTIVDDYLKIYTQHFGYDRLNSFLRQIISNSISTNMIIESLEELGISLLDMENEALIMSWEMAVKNGDEIEVVECINKMINDGHTLKLIHLITKAPSDNVIRKLVMQTLTSQLTENHCTICIAVTDIKKNTFFKLLQGDYNFCINFIDTIFYFGRNMQQVDGEWLSDCDFKYEHLCKVIKILLRGPAMIHKLVYNRLSIVKTQPDNEIWNDVERFIS